MKVLKIYRRTKKLMCTGERTCEKREVNVCDNVEDGKEVWRV